MTDAYNCSSEIVTESLSLCKKPSVAFTLGETLALDIQRGEFVQVLNVANEPLDRSFKHWQASRPCPSPKR